VGDPNKNLDLDKPRTFFNPHPGFAGAAIPIPTAVRKVAEGLDGQTISLREAIARISAVTSGRVEPVPQYDYIGLWLETGTATHLFRVICYG